MAARIYQHYGFTTISTVKENPFALADEVFGIGFMRADAIAQSMGIDPDAPNRIRAGLHFALNQLAKEGHVYSPRALLVAEGGGTAQDREPRADRGSAERRDCSPPPDPRRAGDWKTAAKSKRSTCRCTITSEKAGARERLRDLAWMPSPIKDEAEDRRLAANSLTELAAENNVTLTDQQQGAVRAALANKVSILTGGPGTGKTTTLRMVIHALEALDFKFALASPTGRAAKRLSEATERSASTIHRLLGYSPGEGLRPRRG